VAPLHPAQRLLQALAAHRLGQIVRRLQLEGRERVLGVRRHEDDLGGVGQALDLVRERHAVDAGHMDVQQHHVEGRRLREQRQRLARVRGLGRLMARIAFGQQGLQAFARQRLVVDDEDAHGGARHAAGTERRTR